VTLGLAGLAQLVPVLKEALADPSAARLDALAEPLHVGLAGLHRGLETLLHRLDVGLALGRDLVLLAAKTLGDATPPGLYSRAEPFHIRPASPTRLSLLGDLPQGHGSGQEQGRGQQCGQG
jgi:hypothetical protein